MKKLLIFDLDGTLLNSIDDITLSINLALKDLNLREVSIDEAKYLTGSGVDVLADRTIKLVAGEDKLSLYKDKFKEYYQDYYTIHQKDKTAPYEGVLDSLKELNKNNIKFAVLSNKPHFDVVKIIDYYFKGINFSYVLGKIEKNKIKPAIDGIIMIEDELNIKNKEDILYVGDTNVDIQTARNADLKVIACTWGFRKIDELKEADYIINKPAEFVEIAINEWWNLTFKKR